MEVDCPCPCGGLRKKEFASIKHLARDRRALALTQVHLEREHSDAKVGGARSWGHARTALQHLGLAQRRAKTHLSYYLLSVLLWGDTYNGLLRELCCSLRGCA